MDTIFSSFFLTEATHSCFPNDDLFLINSLHVAFSSSPPLCSTTPLIPKYLIMLHQFLSIGTQFVISPSSSIETPVNPYHSIVIEFVRRPVEQLFILTRDPYEKSSRFCRTKYINLSGFAWWNRSSLVELIPKSTERQFLL